MLGVNKEQVNVINILSQYSGINHALSESDDLTKILPRQKQKAYFALAKALDIASC